MKHLLASSVIGLLLVVTAFVILARPQTPRTFEEYLSIAYCPTFEEMWGEEALLPLGATISYGQTLNAWELLLLRTRAAEPPPPELQLLHDARLDNLPLAIEAWEVRPEPDENNEINLREWPERMQLAMAGEQSHPDNVGLDPDVLEALNTFCDPRIDEYERQQREAYEKGL